ncbi:hypothetical protein KOW79_007080 [Hemibagrus wyckioides]|uniref:Uncharacterized protein n=1 Tax=Hemibagrus wyckioides TaxID=337641 RepID=A0A9D3NUQ6_9TELE|nr:uncharacterized protein LOC131357524 isoform X2 [Hemibagrus wyckioides]KAG7328906.1 hypothetical protein KOW79_007080 [Hemibagrus wyckioides]
MPAHYSAWLVCSTQNDSTRKRRPRGRPRIRPLPPASRSFSTQLTSKHGTVDPTELDLLHTVTPVSAAHTEPIQPIDTLLDDIMTGLHFLPPAESQTHQHGLMSATTSSGPPVSKATYPSGHFAKPTDPKQHLEGEIGDILDHFLRTFEQQVGGCGLVVGDETLQGNDKSDTSTGPWSNTSKTFTQTQPDNLHHETPQANLLHTTSTLSGELQSTVNPSVAGTNNAQDRQIRRSKVKKASRNQNILQQFENRRLTRSQSKKRKLETALISLQSPIKKKCKEKQTAGTRKKRQRNGQGQSEAHVNKSRVKNLDKNNKATKVCQDKSQKPTRKRRLEENRFGRNKRSVDNRRHIMDGFNEREKSHRKGRPRISCGEMMKKVRRDHVETEPKSNSFQADQSSVKSPIRGACIKIASSAMEKVRMLLQLREEEDERANESVGIHQENNAGNGGLVNHKCVSGAEERLTAENSWQGHLEEIRGSEDRRIMVNGEFEGQESRNSVVELSQRRDDKRLRTKEKTTEVRRALFRLNLPSKTGKEGNKDIQDKISTTESVTNILGSCPREPGVRLLPSEVVPLFTQNTMHRADDLSLNVGDAPRLTSAARLSHTQPCQELHSPHTSTKDSQQLAWCSVDEDEDVDVLEVSSPNSELPAVIVEVDSRTEEEEVEEDFEIDVLGLEPD